MKIKRKRPRFEAKTKTTKEEESSDLFDRLPDDLVIFVLSKLSSSAACPADFVSALIVCKRFNRLGLNQLILARAGSNLFRIRAKNWSESAHRFLKQCVYCGSVEACYFLGMIRFYCLQNRASGASLMAKAAIRSHAPALYSLAVIQFNGSGGSKTDKDLHAGVALCARAAYLGHVDALRELGYCLQDGYGIRKNVPEGSRMLVQANARELASTFPSSTTLPCCARFSSTPRQHSRRHEVKNLRPRPNVATLIDIDMSDQGCALCSDFGCNVTVPEPHPANRFLLEWFELKGKQSGSDLRMCSHSGCGRPETRPHEFRRCSVCGSVNYCSRGCQAHDWRQRHKDHCAPMEVWLNEAALGGAWGGVGFGLGGWVVDHGENEHLES
ncbi:hypothetical protein Drorol1_Dr00021454 [Drosera rotundifolia]